MKIRYVGSRPEFGITDIKGKQVFLKKDETVEVNDIEGKGYMFNYPNEFERADLSTKDQSKIVNGLVKDLNDLKVAVAGINSLLQKLDLNKKIEAVKKSEPVIKDPKPEPESDPKPELDPETNELEGVKAQFVAKFDKEVPKNKSKDIERIKAKLAE